MDSAILLEYGWALLILIGLEGLLSADNALVLAVMAKHLPEDQQKKALSYGIWGAFVFRFAALFTVSLLVNVWQIQAIGAAYLMYLGMKHIVKKYSSKSELKKDKEPVNRGFGATVFQIGLADVAFAVDSILAAVAIAIALPETALPSIGGMDGAQFLVVIIAGIAGLVLIRYAAGIFVKLLNERSGLETTAYAIVFWVGVKLAVYTLAHPDVAILSENFAKSAEWKLTFWGVLVAIAVGGWFLSGKSKSQEKKREHSTSKLNSNETD
ncbi:TerC family protein [Aquibacillus sp. 3ASR75-11]|uniref:TerC family protein n=1 Tax=Terrihalobacillus insolitus TaxID=2950438 RepID=A0A9X3WUV2_9BACI|nr:TerC family protein [Terrihalobacillus insolitus]MDC3426060.1 TerC family protein [Terrihalobacillus insolitus]